MLLRGSDAVLEKRGRWARGWVLSAAGSLVHGAASRSLEALLAEHPATHLPLFSKPHPGACTVPRVLDSHAQVRPIPSFKDTGSVSSVTATFAQIRQPSLSLVLLPLQTRAASALFTPARIRPYPTFSDNTAGNGPSLEAEGHREHATGICEHLLCTDTIQGPGNTAVDETEECLLSHPSREDRRKTDTTEEVLGVSDEAQCAGGKTKWGGAAGCQRRGEGVNRGGQSSQNKSQRGTRVAGAGGTALSPGLPFP